MNEYIILGVVGGFLSVLGGFNDVIWEECWVDEESGWINCWGIYISFIVNVDFGEKNMLKYISL